MNITQYLGIPWNKKGRNVNEGLDCWGFARHFYETEYGIVLPMYSNIAASIDRVECTEMIKNSPLHEQFDEVDTACAGDLIFFTLSGMPIHIGVAMNNFKMIHAKTNVGVVVENFRCTAWEKRLDSIYRYKGKGDGKQI